MFIHSFREGLLHPVASQSVDLSGQTRRVPQFNQTPLTLYRTTFWVKRNDPFSDNEALLPLVSIKGRSLALRGK